MLNNGRSVTLPSVRKSKLLSFVWTRCKFEAQLFWKQKIVFLTCIAVQFLHSIAINVAYYRHIQGPRLKDAGFDLIPIISPQLAVLNEILFFFLMITAILVALAPFLYKRPRVYFMTILNRALLVTALCIICRCVSFLATSLPGPAPHCQPESTEYNQPKNWREVIFTLEPFKRCGDLIFSSHTSLSLTFVITVLIYGKYLLPNRLYHVLCYGLLIPSEIILLILIIGGRKHYSVDVVVACYVTPLWYYASYYFVKDEPNGHNSRDSTNTYAQVNDEDDDSSITEESPLMLFTNQQSEKINTN